MIYYTWNYFIEFKQEIAPLETIELCAEKELWLILK